MSARGIKRNVLRALDAVNREIEHNHAGGDKFARGLSAEGYAGGYRDALHDVRAALAGVPPSSRFWPARRAKALGP